MEAARLLPPDNARALIAEAVRNIPQSVKVLRAQIYLETHGLIIFRFLHSLSRPVPRATISCFI